MRTPSITWSDLFVNGTLIDYSVHLWRARVQLTAVDLGIKDSEEVKKAISFGCFRLAPSEAFDDINAVVRAWERDIKYHSLAFPLLTGVRYVPDSEVKQLEEKLKQHLFEFKKMVSAFIQKYSTIKNEMLPVIKTALQDAAQSEIDAAEAFSRVCEEYPEEDVVSEKFNIEWNFFTISIPSSKQAAVLAKKAAPQIQQVLSSMVTELRNELTARVSTLIDMTKKIKDGSSRFSGLNPKNIQSTMDILNRVDNLNFFDDTTIRRQVSNLKRILENDNVDQILVGLTEAKEIISKDVEEAVAKARVKIGKRKLILG